MLVLAIIERKVEANNDIHHQQQPFFLLILLYNRTYHSHLGTQALAESVEPNKCWSQQRYTKKRIPQWNSGEGITQSLQTH